MYLKLKVREILMRRLYSVIRSNPEIMLYLFINSFTYIGFQILGYYNKCFIPFK